MLRTQQAILTDKDWVIKGRGWFATFSTITKILGKLERELSLD